jgi:ABC-type Na+ efflux pump permease subunit
MSAQPAPAEKAFPRFSLARIRALAANTVTQLVRMKILWFLAVFALIVVAAAFAFPVMSPAQQLKLLKDVVFGALQIFSVVIAVAATALLLPRDVEDRTLYTILSKPVPRHEYLVGKLLGVLLLIGGGLLVMDAFFSAVLWIKQTMVTSAHIAALQNDPRTTPGDIAAAQEIIAAQGLRWSLHAGVWCVFLKAAVVASLSLLLSCIATSTLFTILVGFAFTIAGQGQGLLRSFFLKSISVSWKKILSLALAVLCPDLTLFDEVQAVIEGQMIPPATLLQITGFAAGYVALYTAVAHLVFSEKEL